MRTGQGANNADMNEAYNNSAYDNFSEPGAEVYD
jgi:hypothetical protein